MRTLLTGMVVLGALGCSASAHAAIVTTTTKADDITPNDGSVSLREAITAINAGNDLGDPDITAQNPGTFGSTDRISFNVSPSGVQTIGVGTDASAAGIPLPVLIRTVTLDGTTEPGASGSPVIGVALDGTSAGATANGLEAEAAVTIKGVDVEKFHGTGLRLDSTPASSSNSTLQGNVVGANASGTAAAANGGGMLVNSSSNTIKRNVVSGNGVGGAIVVAGTANAVQGNFIGTNAAGTAALANAAAVSITGTGNTVGGTTVAARNVISGNAGNGVSITGAGNTVEGNFIGTNAAGTAAIPNTANGVRLGGGGQTIAGTLAAPQRIWFNGGFGILDTANEDFFHVNSIKGNSAGGISVGLGTPSGSVSLAADRKTVTLTYANGTPGQTVIGEVFENPGAPGCPGQGEAFVGTTSQVVDGTGAGTLTVTLAQPLATSDGLTATLTDTQRGTSAFICFVGVVTPGPSAPGPTALAAITHLRANPAAFPAANSGGSVTARRKRKTGTTISYSDSQAATTTFTVRKPQAGIKDKRRGCVKPPRRKRVKRSQRCTRYVAVGSFKHIDRGGANTFHFTGRIRGRKLKPGSYRLDAVPRIGGRNGRTNSVKFRIIR